MAKTKVFVSFDYEHDKDIKGSLVSQSKMADSNFSINDYSIQYAVPSEQRWQNTARKQIEEADVMIVLCGEFTNLSRGVAAEVTIAQQTNTPYYLLKGRRKEVRRPSNSRNEDKIYTWNWKNLSEIIVRK